MPALLPLPKEKRKPEPCFHSTFQLCLVLKHDFEEQTLIIKCPRPVCLQILANPSHHFIDSSLYKDVILVAWDPAPYSANLNLVSIFLMPWTVGQTVPDELPRGAGQ